jgi:hypothetical protein
MFALHRRTLMLKWLKSLFGIKPTMNESVWQPNFTSKEVSKALDKQAPKKRPRLYKQAVVVTTGELPQPKEKKMTTKPGLYANIHKKQERIEKQKAAGGKVETMRKPGTKGAPTAAAFKQAAKTAKAK